MMKKIKKPLLFVLALIPIGVCEKNSVKTE